MPFETTVGLNVTDPAMYAQYRAGIAPLLEAAGARFRYDFEIARTLKTDSQYQINRLFVIQFPDRDARDRFFADPHYRAVRARYFEPSVDGATTIAEAAT